MDDEMLVRELHRVAHVEEERQSLLQPQPTLVAVGEERLARDVLHDEERAAVQRRAAVDQSCDVGMLEHRQDLPLGTESLQDLVRTQEGIDQLDRDLLREALVVAGGPIDHPHAAAADLLEDPVGAEAVARGYAPHIRRRAEEGGRRIEDAARLFVAGEQ